jgi:hypothetical protein
MGLLRGSMLKTVVTTLGLALSACSVGAVDGIGDDDGDGGVTGDPRAATYATDVLPLMDNKGCNNVSCHGGVQNPQMLTFDKMTSNGLPGRYISTPAASNIIIIKDDPTPGTHQLQPYLDATEKATVSAWLESAP